MSKLLQVDMHEELRSAIQRAAERAGKSVAAYVRDVMGRHAIDPCPHCDGTGIRGYKSRPSGESD